MKKRKTYFKAKQTSKTIILTSGARTYIHLMNIYMDCSYKYKIISQNHGLLPRHTNIGEKETLQRSQGHIPAWVPVRHKCRKPNIYSQRSSGKKSFKSEYFCLFGCKHFPISAKLNAQLMMGGLCWVQVVTQTSSLGLLMGTVGSIKSPSAAVCCLLLHTMTRVQNCLQKFVNKCLAPVCPHYAPDLDDLEESSASPGDAPEVEWAYKAYGRRKRETLGPPKIVWIRFVVKDPAFWSSAGCSCE